MANIIVNGDTYNNVDELEVDKVGGGTQVFELPKNLQNKSVTITQNETVTYTADNGYDGLESLEVTTNVSGGGSSNPYEDIIDNQTSTNKGSFLFSYCQDDDTAFANHFTQAVANKMTKINGTFQGCKNLTTLDLSIIPTLSGSQSAAYMFKECSSLTSITDFGTLTTSSLRSAREMFHSCQGFTSLDLTNLNFVNVSTAADLMFYRCTHLYSITLPLTFVRNDCYNMFYQCSSLTTINCNDFRIASGSRIEKMFQQCNNLTTINYGMSKQDWKDNIAPYLTLFDNNAIAQTITVQCTDGQLIYTNVSGTYTYSITENSTTA